PTHHRRVRGARSSCTPAAFVIFRILCRSWSGPMSNQPADGNNAPCDQTKRLVGAIEKIYHYAAFPREWPSALQAIADVFDDVSTIMIYARDDGRFGTIVSPSLQEANDDYITECQFENGQWMIVAVIRRSSIGY